MTKIALLTSGGDSPGMKEAILRKLLTGSRNV
jgi:6-phosphofructokinase